jgi:DNA-binding response OmpR family regulator
VTQLSRDPRPHTVMVVDDDSDIAELTRLVLEGGGYEVITTPSGVEALRELQSMLPDLILLDISMPDMDGWQVLKALRAEERTAQVPVAMFSIKSEVRDKVRSLQGGAYDYIPKPFSCDELLRRVRRIFEALEQGQEPA